MFTNRKPNEVAVVQQIEEYGKSITSTFFMIENMYGSKQFVSWTSKGCTLPENEERKLAKAWFDGFNRHDICTIDQFSIWFNTHSQFREIHAWVFQRMYVFPETLPHFVENNFFPQCSGIPPNLPFPSVLNLARVLFLNLGLTKHLRSEWRFLFSTAVHGESFSTLINNIMGQGPTMIIIEDTHGYIFGGYASESWIPCAKFVGLSDSFLFHLFPTSAIYETTGYNEHIQYMNHNQQTLPNGVGMGGQFGYCGFWIDADFGHGHSSDSCSTFRMTGKLSKEREFEIAHLEVWGVGPDPIPSEDEDSDNDRPKRSVLDANPAANALLELAGKRQHSEGIRDLGAEESSRPG